eukprot:CAMPEP_0119549866 /NCGR_PEP_ID=MMETSP1352-20130426/3492_1 /TAXON_ID=265584 /ORGANISM="Stauroneis constricta, Strain CCMP1120" /LENGTH=138 /DNA_ID=CAMNT_0007595547 /DNA_START=1149 /DNA_END=1561 /DNA_ORIENTATION=-
MERMTIHIFSSSFLAASQPPPCHHAAKADNAPRTCQMGGKAAGPESGRDDISSPPNDGKGVLTESRMSTTSRAAPVLHRGLPPPPPTLSTPRCDRASVMMLVRMILISIVQGQRLGRSIGGLLRGGHSRIRMRSSVAW